MNTEICDCRTAISFATFNVEHPMLYSYTSDVLHRVIMKFDIMQNFLEQFSDRVFSHLKINSLQDGRRE